MIICRKICLDCENFIEICHDTVFLSQENFRFALSINKPIVALFSFKFAELYALIKSVIKQNFAVFLARSCKFAVL